LIKANIEKVRVDELAYENTLNSIASHIVNNKEIKLVLIAGGSCVGKTTTTRKLSELIEKAGRKALTISLDDYYRNLDESVYLEDGTRDIESINSLRVDLIRESFELLLSGKEAKIPMFDFKTCFRTDDYRRITLKENDVVLIEGLHALDISLFTTVPSENAIFRIYLFADAFDGSDCRFVRRMVRDARHRGATAEDTYALWDNVKKSEFESIEPFRKFADVTINTFFPYERSILNDDAIGLLKTVSRDNSHYETAQKLIKILEPVEQWPDNYVPKNSLLREFM
jgi:uridine kinase